MNREALRGKLLEDRNREAFQVRGHPADKKSNGSALPSMREGIVGGKKLKEAASYLDAARKALLNWTRETCVQADSLETHADHLQEVLAMSATLDKLKGTVEFKAKLYGENT